MYNSTPLDGSITIPFFTNVRCLPPALLFFLSCQKVAKPGMNRVGSDFEGSKTFVLSFDSWMQQMSMLGLRRQLQNSANLVLNW